MKAGFCPHCGAAASEEYNFCPNCGTKLSDQHGPTAASPEFGMTKSESLTSADQAVHNIESVSAISSSETDEAIVCSTCGFQNPVGARSCELCGAFLRRAEKSSNHLKGSAEKKSPLVSEKPKQSKTGSDAVIREKREELKWEHTASRRRFHLNVIQTVSVAAVLLLGGILVYGVMTTKSVTPQQDNTAGADAQQQASTTPPSADVLHEIDRLRQIVDKNPADLVSTLRLSNMLQDNGMYDQAVVYYKRYLDKIPDNIDARVDYGVTLYEGGHTQEAIDQLDRAIRMNPNHQKAFFNLGIVYLNAGEIDKSNDALKKSVQIDPRSDVGKQAQQILQEHANIKN